MNCVDCMHHSITGGCMVPECEFDQTSPMLVWESMPDPFADRVEEVAQIDMHEIVWGDEDEDPHGKWDEVHGGWSDDPRPYWMRMEE